MKGFCRAALFGVLWAPLASGAQVEPREAPGDTDEDREEVAVDTVVVTGTREAGYRATTATTANKSDTPLLETPFSIQVVTRELIEDRGVSTFGEAVRTVPGLMPQVGFNGVNDRFRLRGFATPSNLKNGVRRAVFIPVDELANIEQIEVLKGPASALYGRFEPGGAVNLVTKKPLWTRHAELDFTAGEHDFYRATLDATGPINDDLAYRVTAAWQDSDSFRDFVFVDQQFVSPVLAYRLGKHTRIIAEAEYLHREQGPDRGFGNSPLFLQVPISQNFGEPYERLTNISRLASLTLEHDLSPDWSLRVVGMASDGELNGLYVSYGFPAISGADTADPQVNRSATPIYDEEQDLTGQVEISGRVQWLGLTHRVLMGLEASRSQEDSTFNSAPLGSISLLDPMYGQQPGDVTTTFFATEQKTTALYWQDEVALHEQWRLLLGLRYDRARYTNRDSYVLDGVKGNGDDDALSPRVGLTFLPLPVASIYASWARSFLPDVFARLSDGTVPEPSRGRQFETGVKLELLDGRFTPTLAWFDIRRERTSISDPDDPTFTFSVPAGEQRSKGWELDIPVVLGRQWRLLASYTRMDARFTEHPGLAGNRLANVPRNSGSLWTTYDFAGAAAGLSVGAGVQYVGERQANDSNAFRLPSYARWDANLAYRFGQRAQWRWQLNAQNLADKRYYDSGGSFVPTYPGAPRTITLSLGLRF